MKLELVIKIKEIIAAYQGSLNVCIAEIKKVFEQFTGENGINANVMYKPEYIRETINKEMTALLDSNKKLNGVYNQAVKNIIEAAKKQLLPILFKQDLKPADYATRVATALQLIQIEGKEITDEAAYDILKDFIDDYNQMKIFKRVIGKHAELENAFGGTNFPKTFGKLNRIESILNTFNEMELIAESIFLHKKLNGRIYTVNSVQYILPMDGYTETTDELALVDFASIIDGIAEDNEFIRNVGSETTET